jgi:hypothetical protein
MKLVVSGLSNLTASSKANSTAVRDYSVAAVAALALHDKKAAKGLVQVRSPLAS